MISPSKFFLCAVAVLLAAFTAQAQLTEAPKRHRIEQGEQEREQERPQQQRREEQPAKTTNLRKLEEEFSMPVAFLEGSSPPEDESAEANKEVLYCKTDADCIVTILLTCAGLPWWSFGGMFCFKEFPIACGQCKSKLW
mmetsp:Transcript_46661/g.99019  ORF Transcript_46661/g.99019 Transcript_46661/m.99019 type:complete len:139 (+) Transcript_46661:107-523(+)